MDLNKIFMKNASPTKVGGQAILEGLMMRGTTALAIAMRRPDGDIHLSVEPITGKTWWKKIPILRGVVAFVSSLVTGTGVLLYSAEVLEKLEEEAGEEVEEPDKFTLWLNKTFGEDKAFNVLMYASVVFSIIFVVGFFILLPTAILSLLKSAGVNSVVILNLAEGLFRIAMFVIYILLISRMPDIARVFQYHGAEHKTIHCFENGLELTPENAQQFYTLHPRCGTSFMLFVMIISLIVFSFLGWPNLWMRLLSRLLFIPVIAGLSYELLQFTGRHDGAFVKIMSIPGIYLQKLTTKEPDLKQLEVAIAAMKAVLPYQNDLEKKAEYWVGIVKADGSLVKDEAATKEYEERKKK